jgi:excisionase family DNA binding protein
MTTLLSVSDVAKHLKVCKMTAYRLIWAEKIPAVRAGSQVRVRPSDLAAYLKKSQSGVRGGPNPHRQTSRLLAALALASAANRVTKSVTGGVNSDRTE